MSWAGKLKQRIMRSLFHKEQAPSEYAQVEEAMRYYRDKKLFCNPDPTITEVANRLKLQSVEIHRYFLSQGIDFRTWRTKLRIEEAKRLLLMYPEETVSVVGRRVGINDRSNFCSQFKTFVGDTPQNWRKNQK